MTETRATRAGEDSPGAGGVASATRRSRSALRGCVALLACAALSACRGRAVLDPATAQAEPVTSLWWVMLAVGTAILLIVAALVIAGVARSARGGAPRPLGERQAMRLVVLGGVAIPAVILAAFAIASTMIAREVVFAVPPGALEVEVIGRRWWWEVRYLDEQRRVIAVTANEMHVPVGRPVRFLLRSDDVIHSFWVPRLQGKMDLVPGKVNSAWFVPAAAGSYRGQCAEFCGAEHALMAFEVIAREPAEFADWLARQGRAAAEPASASATRGRRVFMLSGCANCHTIRGTPAAGTVGPDLTHLAGRRMLAAGTVPNDRGHLAGWIADPKGVKPSSLMPASDLAPDELHALVAYLEGLE